MEELNGIELLVHSSIRIDKGKIIYIDPFKINKNYNDADLILCTHSHYDHFSPEDIKKVMKENTMILVTEDAFEDAKEIGFIEENIVKVKPYEEYDFFGIDIETIPAYNKHKEFHPKEKNWVGYVLEIDEVRYYIAGDTDCTKEASNVECDVAFLPVGGTYTMDYIEAASLATKINPKYVIPTHYGSIVGNKEDGELFKNSLSKKIKCELLLKN